MNKKKIGSLLVWLAWPTIFGWARILHGNNPWRYLWGLLAIVGLPLMGIVLLGEEILWEQEEREFALRTKALRRVYLPKNGSRPEIISVDPIDAEQSSWIISPFYYENSLEYPTEQSAREFLLTSGYEEVVALDFPREVRTFWIRKI